MNKMLSDAGSPDAVPVRRELVHRRSPAEVLLTGVTACGEENRFTASAFWPRSHPTFDRLGDGRHNPLLIAETVRQLGMCIPLTFYDCADGSHFLIEELHFELDPSAEPKAEHGGSGITCDVELDDVRVGGSGSLRAFRLKASLRTERGTFAEADGHARVLTDAAYAAVRRRAPSPSPDDQPGKSAGPDQVGVPQPSDVLVAIRPDSSISLSPADALHPFFYDHACDHVPGMVLIEAARQAAALAYHEPRLRPTSCALSAPAFTEPVPAARVTCASDRHRYVVTFRQNGVETAQVTLGRG